MAKEYYSLEEVRMALEKKARELNFDGPPKAKETHAKQSNLQKKTKKAKIKLQHYTPEQIADEEIKIIEKAHKIEKSKGLKEAVQHLRSGLKKFKNSFGLNFEIGQIYYAHNELSFRALKAYMKAYEINPNSFETLYQIGTVYLNNWDADSALEYFDKCLEINPKEPYTLGFKAVAHMWLEQFKLAVKAGEKAVKCKCRLGSLPETLAESYYKLGNYKKAELWFGKMLKKQSDYEWAGAVMLYRYGRCLSKNGNPNKARKVLKAAIKGIEKREMSYYDKHEPLMVKNLEKFENENKLP